MNNLLVVLSAITFISTAIGSYYIISSFVDGASKNAIKAIVARAPQKLHTQDIIIAKISTFVLRFITINPLRREQLAKDLRSVGVMYSPEDFIARSISLGIMYSIAVVPFCFFFPVLIFSIPIIVFITYNRENKKIKKMVEVRTKEIEKELAQFASTIRQHLNTTRDVISIFESYHKIAKGALKDEIGITLNDMKSGNIEKALKSLTGRVNSAKMSELIRGVIGITRGDDQRNYLEMITYDFTKAANEELKREILNRPNKLKINHYLMLGAVLLIFIVSLVSSASESLTLLF